MVAKLGLLFPPPPLLIFYNKFTVSEFIGSCMFCPPGKRILASPVELCRATH